MATSFAIIIREVAKHLNAYRSGDASTVNTDYTVATPTTTQVADPFFSLAFIQDKVIDAHGRLALEIANVRTHPWRSFIGPSTVTVANGAAIAQTAVNGKPIVGAIGQVLNGGRMMSEAAPERVNAYLRHTGVTYNAPDIYYCDGNVFYSSAASFVTVNVCTYDRSDQVLALAANGDITIPDVLADALVAGAVAELVIESKGMEQAAYFLGIFEKAIESIRNGMTHWPMMTLKATA